MFTPRPTRQTAPRPLHFRSIPAPILPAPETVPHDRVAIPLPRFIYPERAARFAIAILGKFEAGTHLYGSTYYEDDVAFYSAEFKTPPQPRANDEDPGGGLLFGFTINMETGRAQYWHDDFTDANVILVPRWIINQRVERRGHRFDFTRIRKFEDIDMSQELIVAAVGMIAPYVKARRAELDTKERKDALLKEATKRRKGSSYKATGERENETKGSNKDKDKENKENKKVHKVEKAKMA